MASQFALFGEIKLKSSNLKAELTRAESMLQKTQRSMTATEAGAGRLTTANKGLATSFKGLVVAGAAVGGVAAFGSVISSGVREIIRYSASLEQIKIGFKTLTGSAAEAEKHIKSLQDFAKKTPFNFEHLAKSSQLLQGVGIETEKIVPLMTAVGNAIAATGGSQEELNAAVRAFAQIQAAGNLKGQEALQLMNANIPIYKLLADEMGLTTAEVKKLGEQGKLSAEDVMKSFQRIIELKFGNAMKEQSNTFNGALSNIQDTLQIVGSKAFAPFYEAASRLSIELAKEIEKQDGDLADVGALIIEKMAQGLGEGIALAVQVGLKQFMEDPWKSLKTGVPLRFVFEGIWKATEPVFVQWIASANAWMTKLAESMISTLKHALPKGMFDAGVDAVTGFVNGIKSRASYVMNAGTLIGQWARDAAKSVLKQQSPSKVFFEIGSNVVIGFINGIESVRTSLDKTMAAIFGQGIRKASEVITDNLREFGSTLRQLGILKEIPLLDKVAAWFKDKALAQGIAETARLLGMTVAQLQEMVTTIIKLQNTGIVDATPVTGGPSRQAPGGGSTFEPGEAQESTGSILDLGTPPKLKALWEDFFATLKYELGNLRDSLQSTKEILGNALIDSIYGIGDVFANAVSQWDGTAKGFFKSLVAGFRQMVQQILAEVIRLMIVKAIMNMIGAFAGGAGGIGGALGGLAGHAGGIGGGIGHGLAPGFAGAGFAGGSGMTNNFTSNFNVTVNNPQDAKQVTQGLKQSVRQAVRMQQKEINRFR